MADALPLFAAHSNVVDFARYRAEHPLSVETRETKTLTDRTSKPVTARAVAHRWLMLRLIATQARVAGGARD